MWNESDTRSGIATGGAPSILFKTCPTYQAPCQRLRGAQSPTSAYHASIKGGEAVIFSGRLGVFAGTSVGPPHWAAIFALANELRAAAGLARPAEPGALRACS